MGSSTTIEGYAVFASLSKKIANRIKRVANYFNRLSEKFHFEQFRIKFGERDDDIYIVTYPKSGTTLLQMILYCLTTDGSMEFNHIYEVSPWIRNDSLKRMKPRELPSPRLIKSHDKAHYFEKGVKGRFIFVYRDGMDVAVSHYHQNKNYNNPKLEFDSYLETFFKTKEWFKFCRGWFRNKHNFPILYLRYEDILNDKRSAINQMIKFLKITPSEDQIERALEYSSFEFMKEHEDKFGEPKPEHEKIYDQFIRKGKSGEGKSMFSDIQNQKYKSLFAQFVEVEEQKVLGSKI